MPDDFVEGVYEEEKVLTGGLRESIKYWVKQDGEAFVLEYLRLDGASTGMEAERLSAADFDKRFEKTQEPEPEEEKSPEEAVQEKLVRQGEIHMEREEFHSAEYEFKNALKLNENNVKANFGLGQSFSGQGRTEEAREVFAKLGDNDDLYKEENKHTFNELGIALRREEMYDDAVKNYHRAIQIDSGDPVLYYNISLALYHSGQVAAAKKFLTTSIELDGGFEEAIKLMVLVEKNS
jgi:tetratricopeptide (TPR) repeat protein